MIVTTINYNVISFQDYRMTSTISIEKKKNKIPPPIIAIQAAICLSLDIMKGFSKLIIESN